jgi:hypothetical protein
MQKLHALRKNIKTDMQVNQQARGRGQARSASRTLVLPP